MNSYLLERYFGPDWITNVTSIRAGYQRILDGWFDWDPTFECHAQTEADCPHADPHKITLAYVTKRGAWPFTPTPFGSVHICAKAFAQRNMQELAATVVHELSHRLDNTGDPAYCSDPPMCNLPTKKAWTTPTRTLSRPDDLQHLDVVHRCHGCAVEPSGSCVQDGGPQHRRIELSWLGLARQYLGER